MNERVSVLKADLRAARQAIESAYAALGSYGEADWDRERTILVAYHLHGLYGGFENAFQRIAEAFENEVPDPSRWHALLLQRMTLDIEGVRPRFVGDEAFDCLDELRRFRHVFRTAYAVPLDPQRLKLVWEKAQKLRCLYPVDFERFLAFLDGMDRP